MITKFPRTFYEDHRERDLPSPWPIKATKTHVWLDCTDKNFQELVNDAEHYAHVDGPDGASHVVRAAKAFLKVLNP